VPNFSREVKQRLAASREEGNSAEVIEELQRTGQLPTKALVQSGAFLIEKGKVHAEGDKEPTVRKEGIISTSSSGKKGEGGFRIQDVVLTDDLIVSASACIGLDCVSGEVFGFDTIRLKENNLRIKFEDTSTGAGFPTNDWQLTANDSVTGGLSKFSVEDITGSKIPFTIEAGATTDALYVNSNGKVGLRTSTPVKDLHLVTSNTPSIRLEQTEAGGFSPYSWDLAGNETNFFIRDVNTGFFPFRIDPGAPSWSIRIDSDGNVGVGTGFPAKKLHVKAGQVALDNGHYLYMKRTNNNFQEALGIDSNDDLTFNRNSMVAGVDADAPKAASALIFGTGADKFMDVRNSANTTLLRVQESNGNVGIGTASPAGKLDVNGSIFQRGIQLFADYVFEPTYDLESIEDHSAFMWGNKHLPAVGAKTVDEQGREVVEIGARMRGLLEELEKAHIYISALNTKVTERDEQVAKLVEQNGQLAERLAQIEARRSPATSELEKRLARLEKRAAGKARLEVRKAK
jgi:hypothetical protein